MTFDPRCILVEWLFRVTSVLYDSIRTGVRGEARPAWGLSSRDLQDFPEGTLGRALGAYLEDRGFELMDGHESHDVFHLLTGVGNDAVSEVALQWLLLGNGKRTPYLFGAVAVGTLLFPEQLRCFARHFRRGRQLAPMYDVDYRARLRELLPRPPTCTTQRRSPGTSSPPPS